MDLSRYADAVENIRDTTKWLLAALGGVFLVLLAGVQFNKVPFFTDRIVALAGIIGALGIMLAFALAVRVLVSPGLTFSELATHRRFRSERAFLDQLLGGAARPHEFTRFCTKLAKMDAEFQAGTVRADDAGRVGLNAMADELLSAASWHVTKRHFQVLVWVVLLLMPVELAAAGAMVNGVNARGDHEMTITVKGG